VSFPSSVVTRPNYCNFLLVVFMVDGRFFTISRTNSFVFLAIYTSLFTKMVASKEKKKKKNTYIQKYTINKNGNRNKNKE